MDTGFVTLTLYAKYCSVVVKVLEDVKTMDRLIIEEGEDTVEQLREYFDQFRTGAIDWVDDQTLYWTVPNFAEVARSIQVDEILV